MYVSKFFIFFFTIKSKLGNNIKPTENFFFLILLTVFFQRSRKQQVWEQFSAYHRDKQAASHLHCDKF